MKRGLLLILLLAGLGVRLEAEIKFLQGPLAGAVKKAKAEKKPVMIDFITDWCRWCDTLDRNTYSDARVAGLVNGRMVPIKIDAEKGEGIQIARKYAVRGYPTILLIQASGEEIDRLIGYMPPEPFMKSLDEALHGVNTLSTLKAAAERDPADAGAHYRLAKKYADRSDLAGALPHFKRLLELDPSDKLGHGEEARFNVAMHALREARDPAPLEEFVNQYASSSLAGPAASSLLSFAIRQKKGDDARRYFEQCLKFSPNKAGVMNNYAWNCAEQKLNLDHAADVAAQAVALAARGEERAMYLDTQATVEFARGNRERAVTLEEEALGLLKNATPADRKGYEETLAKFKAGGGSRSQ